ncbi:MAG: shikimate kinase [Planctomycetota bacterium]
MTGSHLFLIGYRGSGKSTIGAILAAALKRPFLDTDAWIEQYAHRSIPEIFASEGEEAFRELETLAIERLPRDPSSVGSLGGGAVLRVANRELLRSSGRIVWLRADPNILAQRLSADSCRGFSRPSLTGEDPIREIEHVLATRTPIYKTLCDWELETVGRTPSELAQAIADWYASSYRDSERNT